MYNSSRLLVGNWSRNGAFGTRLHCGSENPFWLAQPAMVSNSWLILVHSPGDATYDYLCAMVDIRYNERRITRGLYTSPLMRARSHQSCPHEEESRQRYHTRASCSPPPVPRCPAEGSRCVFSSDKFPPPLDAPSGGPARLGHKCGATLLSLKTSTLH